MPTYLPSSVSALICGLLFVSCGRTDVDNRNQRLLLEPARVPEVETLHYRIVIAGIEVGTRLQATDTTTLNLTVPAFSVMTVDRVRLGNVEQADSTIVQMSRDSLFPVAAFRFLRKGPLLVTAAALFRQANTAGATGSVGITTYEEGTGEVCRALPFGAGRKGCGELSLLGWLGRAIALATGQEDELLCAWLLSEPPGGAVLLVRVRSDGEETVTVPAGSFECKRMQFVIGGADTLRCWYAIAGTHQMIRSQSSTGELVELVNRRP